MAASYGFHPEALFEYAEATNSYLHEASSRVADRFVTKVESAVAALVAAPTRWRVVEEPEMRRYVFSRFPFVSYYRWSRSMRASLFTLSCTVAGSQIIGITASNEAPNHVLPRTVPCVTALASLEPATGVVAYPA